MGGTRLGSNLVLPVATRAVELSSLKRLKESGQQGITGRSMQLLFEMPEPDDAS